MEAGKMKVNEFKLRRQVRFNPAAGQGARAGPAPPHLDLVSGVYAGSRCGCLTRYELTARHQRCSRQTRGHRPVTGGVETRLPTPPVGGS